MVLQQHSLNFLHAETTSKAQNIAEVDWENLKNLIENLTTGTNSSGPATVAEVVRCWGLLLKVNNCTFIVV